jgi:hypothetical protein
MSTGAGFATPYRSPRTFLRWLLLFGALGRPDEKDHQGNDDGEDDEFDEDHDKASFGWRIPQEACRG